MAAQRNSYVNLILCACAQSCSNYNAERLLLCDHCIVILFVFTSCGKAQIYSLLCLSRSRNRLAGDSVRGFSVKGTNKIKCPSVLPPLFLAVLRPLGPIVFFHCMLLSLLASVKACILLTLIVFRWSIFFRFDFKLN